MHLRIEKHQPMTTHGSSISKADISFESHLLVNDEEDECPQKKPSDIINLQDQPKDGKLNDDSSDVEMIEDSNDYADNSPVKINAADIKNKLLTPLEDAVKLQLDSGSLPSKDTSQIDSKQLESKSSSLLPSPIQQFVDEIAVDTPKLETTSNSVEPIPVVVSSEISSDGLNQQSTQTEPIPTSRKRSRSESVEPKEAVDESLIPPSKRLCAELERNFGAHDRTLREYIDQTANNNLEDVHRHLEQLQSDIIILNELSAAKEMEWNNILHLKKCKEEIIVRLNRRKIVMEIMGNKMGDVPVDADTPNVRNPRSKQTFASVPDTDMASFKNECVAVAALSQPSSVTNNKTQSILASRANMKSADLVKEKANTTRLHR